MKKIYVLDTSVYLTSANAIYDFKNNDIAIPIKVLEELDKHKKRQDAIGANARHIIRILDSLREKGSLSKGVRLDKGKGLIKIINSKLVELPTDLSLDIADNKIIAATLRLVQDEPERKVILVSRDINMRVIANSLHINAEDFSSEHVVEDRDELFTGLSTIKVNEAQIQSFYNEGLKGEMVVDKLLPNEFVKMITENNEEAGLGRYDLVKNQIVHLNKVKDKIFGINAKNDEQKMAIDLLLNPDIPIVTLVGRAGSGKTLCAIAAGLDQVLEKRRYKRLIISRPVQPVGRDIGYLPGTLEEKMLPWLKPIQDNLEFLMNSPSSTIEAFMEKGIIELEAISYIRGRSIPETFMIIDEAQNLTVHELKTIITRVGEKTKIVLTGDIEQIDNTYIDDTSNGLSYAVEKFKNSELAGHVTLQKGERSAVATLAAEIL